MRLGAMGDLVHALSAATALRELWPECRIGWAIERRWLPLVCAPDAPLSGQRGPQRPLVDEVFPLDIRYWRSHFSSAESWRRLRDEMHALRSAAYKTAVDVQGAIRSALIARLSGASQLWGDASPRERIAALFYRHPVAVYGRHVIEQNLALLSAVCGTALAYRPPLLPRDETAAAWCEQLLGENIPGRFALLSPGAGWGAKCWPAASFGEVARRLREVGIASLVNHGPGEEPLAREVASASDGAAQPVACSLSQLMELTRRASLFIGGDSGPMHLAAAFRVPVVALFGPTDPGRNGPYGTASVVLRSRQSATSYHHTSRPDPALAAITPEEVMQAATGLLEKHPNSPERASGNRTQGESA